MNMAKSKYYYKPKGNTADDLLVLEKIKDIAEKYPSYGYRRITPALRRDGLLVNHKKVYRIMKANGICCSIRRAYRHTTNSSHSLVKYPNLIKDIIPARLNHVWHADITYIRFAASFAYLAAIMDGLSRKAVGYAIGKTLSASLTISALLDAMGNKGANQ